jgi:hypothetical protein
MVPHHDLDISRLSATKYVPSVGGKIHCNGVGRVSREQLAQFYEVSVATIDTNNKRRRDEFDVDGAEVIEGKDLKDAKGLVLLLHPPDDDGRNPQFSQSSKA